MIKNNFTSPVDFKRMLYPQGTIICLQKMQGEDMPSGITGIVDHIDDAGQIHVKWANGSSLRLNPEIDEYSCFAPKKSIKALKIEPNKEPCLAYLENNFPDLSRKLGEDVSMYVPFLDDVAILYTEKKPNQEVNRLFAIRNLPTFEIYGTFYLVGMPIEENTIKTLSARQYLNYKKILSQKIIGV